MAAPGLAGPSGPPRSGRRPSNESAVVLCVCGPALAAALLAPPRLQPAGVAAAFVAGATVERYRQGRRERPLQLADTPGAWARTVRDSVGTRHALTAGVAGLAALVILLLPSLSADHVPDRAGGPDARGPAPATHVLPQIEVIRRSAGRPFAMRGISFRVLRVREPAASVGLLHRPAGRGMTWMLVRVDVRNFGRRRFPPNALAYRLRDERGRSYWSDIGGGTGPASLGRTGFLERGETAQARLAFTVPRSARSLTLVFEPLLDGSIQVEVPLARDGSD